MRFVGAPGSEDRKKFLAVCGFVLVAVGVLYYELRDSSGPVAPPPAPVVITAPASTSTGPAGSDSSNDAVEKAVGPAAKVIGTTSAALDPTLHMDAMLVTESMTYEGSGRNIFSVNSAPPPVVIPKPVANARQVAVVTPPPVYHAPVPPPPPPIDLKFCGYFASPKTGDKRAILLHGDDVILAVPGDIVMRRYRIVSIATGSIEVEDMQYNNKQTLPLQPN